MRTIVRILSAIALVVSAVLVPAVASAKPAPAAKVAKWAKKHHLRGAWRTKDADKDGLKNLNEFRLGTDPRRADSDRDGLRDGDEITVGDDPTDPDTDGDRIKDGAEHAGVVTAFDGATVTVRQFKGGKLTAALSDDADCSTADESADEDDAADDDGAGDEGDDDGYVGDDSEWTDDDGGAQDDDGTADASTVDDDPTDIDLGAGDSSVDDDPTGCSSAGLEKGAVIRSLELSGGAVIAVELAD
jgi:hypothetical protein